MKQQTLRRITLVTVAALIATAAPALAADMAVKAQPLPASFSWTGLYAGGNVGWGWASDRDPALIVMNNYYGPINTNSVSATLPATLYPNGVTGGVQIGYNWQSSNYVFGVEADFSALGGKAQRNATTQFINGAPVFIGDSSQDRWQSTLRLRAGYVADRALFYATGGVAFASWSISHSYADTSTPIPLIVDAISSMRTGWVAGGGVEYALTNNWIARAEYLYAGYGNVSSSLSLPPPAGVPTVFNYSDHLKQSIARGGISYKF
jgi:outer membrane immunogenic protein